MSTQYPLVARRPPMIFVVALAVILSVMFVGEALAAGTWYWYDMTIPKFGGSNATSNQLKEYAGQAKVQSNLIGGNYDLNMRLEDSANSSKSAWYKINDGTVITYNNSAAQYSYVHMRLKTDTFDPVDIQANGNWSPDTP